MGKFRQTGKKQTLRGKFLDAVYHAKKPGKRVSASGKTYYERRRNRSDVHRWV